MPGFRGCLDYVMDKDKGAELVAGNMAGETARELAAEFGQARKIKSSIRKPVWHGTLSCPPGERLSAEKWNGIVADFMEGMGFTDLHQFVTFRHSDTSLDHVHIVASRIGLDGEVWKGRWE